MPDIRGIFLYRGENLVYSQIFPIIEKELKKKLGPKYEELPDEYLLHAYIMKVNLYLSLLLTLPATRPL